MKRNADKIVLAYILMVALPLAIPSLAVNVNAEEAADGSVSIVESNENYTITMAGYTAVVDKPCGNLIGIWLRTGEKLLGCENGTIQGVCAYWNDSLLANHVQKDDGNCPEVKITFRENVINAECGAFDETYKFLESKIQVAVEVKASDLLAGDDFHVYFGSGDAEFSADAPLGSDDWSWEHDAYPTDYMTDQSSGYNGIASARSMGLVASAGVGKAISGKLALGGFGTWFMNEGTISFEKGSQHRDNLLLAGVESRRSQSCGMFGNEGQAVHSALLRSGMYIVSQSDDWLSIGDISDTTISIGDNGYDVIDYVYPVNSDNGMNNLTATAIVLIPKNSPPPNGYKLQMACHGLNNNPYMDSYVWRFMANMGYIVAMPWYTGDIGGTGYEGENPLDLMYHEQEEIDGLRLSLIKDYKIDQDRQYIAGQSLGGINTMLSIINHPDVYAAAAEYAGVYDVKDPYMDVWFRALGAPAYDTEAMGGSSIDRPFEWSIRTPRDRIGQAITPLAVIHGISDPIVPYYHALELFAEHSVALFCTVPWGWHEADVWESYRKDVMNFFESNARTDYQENNVHGQFNGRPEFEPIGYAPSKAPLYHNNSWLSVLLLNGSYTQIDAVRSSDGYSIRLNKTAEVKVALPDNWAASGIEISGVGGFEISQGWIEFQSKENFEHMITCGEIKGSENGGAAIPGFESATMFISILGVSVLLKLGKEGE